MNFYLQLILIICLIYLINANDEIETIRYLYGINNNTNREYNYEQNNTILYLLN